MKKLLPKGRRERSPMDKSQNIPRRNSKATVTTAVRVITSLLAVVLQKRINTKTKTDKAKVKSHINIVEKMEDSNDLFAMISKCHLFGNSKEWFLDSSATKHICSPKEAFTMYALAEFDGDIFIGNTTTTKIVGTR